MVGIFKTVTFMVLLFASGLVFADNVEDYDVGDDFEWNRPPNPMFYSTWAARKFFRVGDELDFDFEYGRSDVAVVTKEAYENCTKENPISLMTVPTVTIRLNTTGPQYYISTIGDNCLAGQKLTVSVTGRGAGRADYDVGDDFDWNRPPNPMFYSTWAARKIFRLGDELDFDFDYGRSDVATVTKEAFEDCTKENPISLMTVPTVTIRLNTTGPQYYISTIGDNCLAGQKLTVNVTGPGGVTPGAGRGVITPAPKTSPGPAVGGPTVGVTTGTGIQTGNAGALLSTGVTFLVAFVSAIVVGIV